MRILTTVRNLISRVFSRRSSVATGPVQDVRNVKRDEESVEFLECRLRSIDKMLAGTEVQSESRLILERMRSEIENQLLRERSEHQTKATRDR
jgi:hypothetical protein